jgi:hypothetical protein
MGDDQRSGVESCDLELQWRVLDLSSNGQSLQDMLGTIYSLASQQLAQQSRCVPEICNEITTKNKEEQCYKG